MKTTTQHGLTTREIFTHPGVGRCNEDAAGGGEGYLYVIDGATGLGGGPASMTGAGSDAAWLAQETARWLDRSLGKLDVSIPEILWEGMARLRYRWKGAQMPTAGIAIFRCRGEWVEFFALGDCTGSVEGTDGSFRAWEEEGLHRLDALALEELAGHARRLGCAPAACLPLIRETLIRHRALCNRPGGYWALDPSGVGIPHARKLTLPAQTCRSLFLCTDGFAQYRDFASMTLAQLHQAMARRGAPALAEELFAWQEADPGLAKLPRFKLRDDASAAYGRLW